MFVMKTVMKSSRALFLLFGISVFLSVFIGPVFIGGASFEASAQTAPTVSVSRVKNETKIVIGHPSGLQHINWGSFRFDANGMNLTTPFLGIIGSPFAPITINPGFTALTITVQSPLAGWAINPQVCTLTGNPPSCGNAVRILQAATGYPNTKYTSG